MADSPGQRCKAITREVNRLCNEVRMLVGDLVASFGIPDEVRAPRIAIGKR